MPKTDEVFGIRTQLVLSYVVREDVDTRFKDALDSDHHILVYGSSKQGKTSLRQKHLNDRNCLIVRCGPRMSIETLYQSVLRQAGATIQTMETRSTEKTVGAKVSTGFLARIPFLGGGEVSAEASAEAKRQQELATEFIAHDFGDAQSIAELLVKLNFKKWIVLENYHYLPAQTQKDIAFDLKTFHEIGIRFLILGIWKEANLLITHNGDLQDRIIEIPVEPWRDDSLNEIAATGSGLLNIVFSPNVLEVFRLNAYGNVGLFQEFLKVYCLECGVAETVEGAPRVLDAMEPVGATIKQKLESQRSALLKNLQGIAAKSRVRQSEQPLLLPYYLVQVVLTQDISRLEEGIDRSVLLELLRQVHHRKDKDKVRASDVTNLLTKLPVYQDGMTPPLLYYDGNSRRVRVVDSRIFFVLANADRKELAEEIPLPEVATDNGGGDDPDDGDETGRVASG